MKNLILSFLTLICITANAQNQLIDLYSLNPGNHYPTNMPHVKQWINTTLTPIFIRNLQFSNNQRSSSKFIMFNPVVRNGSTWPLAEINGLKIIPNSSTIRGQYDQEIFSYLRAFDITTFDYQHRTYFQTAKELLHITDDQMLAHILNFFIEPGKKSKYQQMIDQVNKIKNVKLAYPATENVHALTVTLQQKYADKISDVIFDCYINGRNEEETLRNMQRFYNVTGFFRGPVESRIDELINPKLQFKQDKSLLLQLPATALKLSGKPDSTAVFSIETGTAVLNYHKRQLEIIFKGKMNADAAPEYLKVIDYDKNEKITLSKLSSSAKPQAITELWLTVSENGTQLIGVTMDYGRYMLIDQPWKQ